jgi:hypothetical protein
VKGIVCPRRGEQLRERLRFDGLAIRDVYGHAGGLDLLRCRHMSAFVLIIAIGKIVLVSISGGDG